uniref:Uncharacterized protein n=1 Tax=Hyaloperonospora arabidopsidis (strain Emoy2) TaxID=559515 RepID=M4B1K0_HYAAE
MGLGLRLRCWCWWRLGLDAGARARSSDMMARGDWRTGTGGDALKRRRVLLVVLVGAGRWGQLLLRVRAAGTAATVVGQVLCRPSS